MFFDYLVEHNRYLNLVGIAVILGLAALCSKKRTAIDIKLIGKALLLQFFIALIVLKTAFGKACIATVAHLVAALYSCADTGISFMFGSLTDPSMPWGFVFAIKVLPIIIFFGALTAVLFHLGIIQLVVHGIQRLIHPVLGTSGAETLCAVANSFLGQTEAPLLVRNYLARMTKSEIMVVMVSGMATISGAIVAVFAAMGVPVEHILSASVMAIPGSLMIAKILYPETETQETEGGASVTFENPSSTIFDAMATGTLDGLRLALNVGAMLIAFLAFLALINGGCAWVCEQINHMLAHLNVAVQIPIFNLDTFFSYLMYPFAYLLGFTGNDALVAGKLLGTKVAINEVIAYGQLVKSGFSERMVAIMTYALCGFSNFSCIGIQVGGIGALVPEKRAWITELGLYAVLGGALSNLLSAMVASLLL
ncbi:MAG TPA: nucleoside transporter C-terminal domain-containing protein [Candidatus Limnocylindria bacterium]|nr:nucleoside transporter C-terminal domain-containing protein [Candidatus Limnocylindria bacterium]